MFVNDASDIRREHRTKAMSSLPSLWTTRAPGLRAGRGGQWRRKGGAVEALVALHGDQRLRWRARGLFGSVIGVARLTSPASTMLR
jgi:hypothetical protein